MASNPFLAAPVCKMKRHALHSRHGILGQPTVVVVTINNVASFRSPETTSLTRAFFADDDNDPFGIGIRQHSQKAWMEELKEEKIMISSIRLSSSGFIADSNSS
jgi:hypothetical protein